jgi:hypothetical protein
MMDALESLFASGRIIDAILVLMALEAVVLLWFHRATGKGVGPRTLLPFLAAGVCLMLALRTALTGGSWTGVAAMLSPVSYTHLTLPTTPYV